MITIERVSPQEMLRRHATAPIADVQTTARTARVVNTDSVLQLHAVLPFRFRGRVIPARPLPFRDGVRLMELAEQAERAMEHGDMRGYESAVGEAMDICWMNAGPPWLPRWAQRLRRNPFQRASAAEVRDILHFFGRCQMLSLAGGPSIQMAGRRRTWTS